MRKSSRFLPCLVAAGIALAPLPAFAEEFEGFSLKNLSIGLEVNYLNKGVDASTDISQDSRLPSSGIVAAHVDNSVDGVTLTEVLSRVNYRFNDNFIPYLLLGTSGLSFDDRYQIEVSSLPSTDTTVHYSGSQSPGFGFGIEGLLMELPEKMKLSYGMRMFTFTSSDDAAVPPEEISSLLASLNPVEKVNFSTDVTFREWDFSLGVSREFQIDDNFSITPQLGYRHCSISMEATTDVVYSPGMPNYLQGTIDRSLGASLSSVTLGATGNYQEYVGATLQVAVGNEMGISLAVSYKF